MGDSIDPAGSSDIPNGERPISLKELARTIGLSPTTVSLVLNDSPAGKSIPKSTRDKVIAAAERLQYRPNLVAKSLRSNKSCLLGVLVPEVSEGYSSHVLAGIESMLLSKGYAYLVTGHRHKPELLRKYLKLLRERRVEGLIGVDTPLDDRLLLPAVAVSGHRRIPGVTNIILDHDRAAELALGHLRGLGHTEIAFIRGQRFSSDTETRWQAIKRAAAAMNIRISPRLVAQLEEDDPSPQPGFLAARRLLASGRSFTALFAFNDISAIGAIRCLRDSGREVPRDISVVGFDDIHNAAFHNPSLTTIRQPLWEMGRLAAETVLRRLSNGSGDIPLELVVGPELVIRESTASYRPPT